MNLYSIQGVMKLSYGENIHSSIFTKAAEMEIDF